MLNRYGFIPKKYRQPDRYRLIFENWAAVFIVGHYEYHVELVADRHNKKTANSVEILCQGAKCRNTLVSEIPSVKQAMERLEAIIKSDSERPTVKNCKFCGAATVWENPYLPGHFQASSCDIEGWPVCRDCMIEHCCNTNCFECEYGKSQDCRFLEMKRHYKQDD